MSVLSDFVRIARGVAHQHRPGRPDDGPAVRGQRARPARHRARRSSFSPRSSSTWPRARRCASSPARCRAGWTSTSTAADPRGPPPRRPDLVDTDGDPLLRAVRAEPDVISPNVLEAEELVGHEFNDEDDHASPSSEMVELGAREAIMTIPDGCIAQVAPEDGSQPPRYFRVTIPAIEADGDDRLRRRVPRRLRRRALHGPLRAGLPGLRRRVRRRVHPAPRRRRRRPRGGRTAARRGRSRRSRRADYVSPAVAGRVTTTSLLTSNLRVHGGLHVRSDT